MAKIIKRYDENFDIVRTTDGKEYIKVLKKQNDVGTTFKRGSVFSPGEDVTVTVGGFKTDGEISLEVNLSSVISDNLGNIYCELTEF